jgi:taurine transport system permease protein
MLGTPRWRFIREVLVPAASPMIFTGLRLSLQASWTTLVAAELVGAFYGLGRVLNVAQQDLYPGMILVGMVAVAIFGWGTTRLLGVLETYTLRWNTAALAAKG